MSTIEIDPATLIHLDDSEWALLALAGVTPETGRPRTATILAGPTRDGARDLALPVGCFAPDPADLGAAAWAGAGIAAPYPTVEPPGIERECALEGSFAPEV